MVDGPQGYLVDMRGVQFDDAAQSTWIHAMTVGEYDHPVHGRIKITPERIHQFAQNVRQRVRETDLDIDYDHKANGGDAAGWVQAADERDNGLWLLVKWTQTAYQKLKEGAYRYFSPEFHDEWRHPKTGQTFKDVLFGGAITNRPFLRDIMPINMTEVIQASGGSGVNPDEVLKEIAKLLGLPDGTDPAVVLGHIQARFPQHDPNAQQQQPQPAPKPTAQHQGPPPAVAASEEGAKPEDKPKEGVSTEDPLKALSENPVVKQMMDTIAAQGKILDEQAVDKAVVQLSEKAATKSMIIPPVVKDAFKKQLSELPPANRQAAIALMETMIENGQVGVSAAEHGHAGHSSAKTAEKAFSDAVQKKLNDSNGKLSFAEASTLVAGEQPSLYIDYQRELAGVS